VKGEERKMRKLTTRLIIALLTFLLGVTAATAWYLGRRSANQEVRLIIPNSSWEPIFFRQINSVANLSRQADLRSVRLPAGDFEVRVWRGFGLSPLEGLSLRRVSGQWSAIHVRADKYHESGEVERTELSPPKSGWEACWQRLLDAGILTLPDASEANCAADGFDGISFVVETNVDSTYRTFKYANPTIAECDEARQMVKIIEIIDEEFKW
jgi:hypothetical protein